MDWVASLTTRGRKDDYAFFIRPVDPAQVPGYADVIKTPMDLGTMTVKVARGKYRSLDEFTVRPDGCLSRNAGSRITPRHDRPTFGS